MAFLKIIQKNEYCSIFLIRGSRKGDKISLNNIQTGQTTFLLLENIYFQSIIFFDTDKPLAFVKRS